MRSGTISLIFSRTGIFRGVFSIYHYFLWKDQRSCDGRGMGGGVLEPKKTDVRSGRASTTKRDKNPLVTVGSSVFSCCETLLYALCFIG
jgi:hypothetical protein